MGLFALIMSVYNFGITFACSGINLASTKVISEEIAQGKSKREAVNKCLFYSMFFGALAFLLIFLGAPFFAEKIVGDERIELPLKILSLSLPCVSASFALGGYFTATGRVYKNSAVQVIEQFVRIISAVILLNFSGGQNAKNACVSLVLSGTIAEIISFSLLMVVYKLDVRKEKAQKSKNISRRVLKYGLPVAASAYIRSALSTTEHTLIPKMLEKFNGTKDAALSAYGVVHGMVMPMIFLPSGVVSSVATLLIPEITMLRELKKFKKIDDIIERTLSLTMMFSIGASGIMYFFAEEIGILIYNNYEAAHFLKLVAPLAAIMYADGVVDAVLKGLNQEIYAMRYDIILSGLSIFLISTLIPQKGVYGYILIIYISEMLNAYLSINRLMEVSGFRVRPFLWVSFPAISILISCAFSKSLGINSLWGMILAIALYSCVMMLYVERCTLYKRKSM